MKSVGFTWFQHGQKSTQNRYYLEILSRTESSCWKCQEQWFSTILGLWQINFEKKLAAHGKKRKKENIAVFTCFFTCLDFSSHLKKIAGTPVEKHWSRERGKTKIFLLYDLHSLSLSFPAWRGKNKVGDKLPILTLFINTNLSCILIEYLFKLVLCVWK